MSGADLNRQLREAQDAVGRAYMRPQGAMIYTVRSAEYRRIKAWLTVVSCVCDTPVGERVVPWSSLRKMIDVTP